MCWMSDQAKQNRARCPLTAAFVDEMRSVFGAGVKLVWAEENGQTLGVVADAGVAVSLCNMVVRPPVLAAAEKTNGKGKR